MDELQAIPSSVSINKSNNENQQQNIPSSVIQCQDNSSVSSNTQMFNSFTQTNIRNLAETNLHGIGRSTSSIKQKICLNSPNNKIMNASPSQFNQLKLNYKFLQINQSDSDLQQQDSGTNQSEDNKIPAIQNNQPDDFLQKFRKKKIEKDKQKISCKNKSKCKIDKQQQKINHLSLTATSQSLNFYKRLQKAQTETLLLRQICKNKELEQQLILKKQENKHLREIICQIKNQSKVDTFKNKNKRRFPLVQPNQKQQKKFSKPKYAQLRIKTQSNEIHGVKNIQTINQMKQKIKKLSYLVNRLSLNVNLQLSEQKIKKLGKKSCASNKKKNKKGQSQNKPSFK